MCFKELQKMKAGNASGTGNTGNTGNASSGSGWKYNDGQAMKRGKEDEMTIMRKLSRILDYNEEEFISYYIDQKSRINPDQVMKEGMWSSFIRPIVSSLKE